jgi:outer membrane protein OmpA-like peptidoglycan-associated protein
MLSRKTLASVLVLASLALAGAAHAEVTGVKLNLTPYAGITLWDQLVKLEEKAIYGGRVGLQFGRYIGVEGTYGFSPTEATSFGPQSVDVTHYGADLMINLTKPYRVTPYIIGGWAQMVFDPLPSQAGSLGKQSYDGWEAGAGVKIDLLDRLHLRLDGRDVFFTRDAPLPDNWVHNFVVSAGLGIVLFGHVKDSDGDWCQRPQGQVPEHAARGDGGRQGLSDRQRRRWASTTASTSAPTPEGRARRRQGLSLGQRRRRHQRWSRPVRQHAARRQGRHPRLPDRRRRRRRAGWRRPVRQHARRRQGRCQRLPDGQRRRRCLRTASTAARTRRRVCASTRGCPIEVNERETQLLDTGMIRMNNVNFATGKSEITADSYAALDEVGQLLSNWPQLQIEVGGHTDARGSAAKNQTLSEARAKAVLDYLERKFPSLNPSQFSAKGYGESQPVADNKTASGMAQNRRVEFKVLNRETLRKEIDQRKLLKKD